MAFKDYLGLFMKLFLDDFNVFNNLDTVYKATIMLLKMQKLQYQLEPSEMHVPCALTSYLGLHGIQGKLLILKFFWLLSICLSQKQLRAFKFTMAWHNTTGVSLRNLLLSWLPLPSHYTGQRLFSGQQSVNTLGKISSSITWTLQS